nr:glutathione S-transferase omega 3 [Conogethes punctiferalis]
MIASTVSLATHILVSSWKLLSPVSQVLQYVLPYYSSMAPKIDFNTKHLGKGDPLPPFTGKLRVYNMRYCPFAQRTILALNAKQIDYEVVNIDLMNKPEWLFTKSGFGKVPSVEAEENVCIFESLVTVEYIDELYPDQRPLLPKDPARKALDKIIVEAMAPVYTMFTKCLRTPDAITDADIASYYKALDFLQDQLKSRGTKFLNGDEPGYVDYMIWPWFERLLILDPMDGKMAITAEKYKLLSDYLKSMFEDPAVVPYLVPKEVLQKLIKVYTNGQPFNYDTFHKD